MRASFLGSHAQVSGSNPDDSGSAAPHLSAVLAQRFTLHRNRYVPNPQAHATCAFEIQVELC
ncbi:hypothetical protein JCM10914A_16590 [Paenibacillus sp. JCM 10914]